MVQFCFVGLSDQSVEADGVGIVFSDENLIAFDVFVRDR